MTENQKIQGRAGAGLVNNTFLFDLDVFEMSATTIHPPHSPKAFLKFCAGTNLFEVIKPTH